MTDSTKRPAFDAFVVEGDGKEAFWTKVGAAWPHDDGKGFNLKLIPCPLNWRIAMRVPKERDPKTEHQERDKQAVPKEKKGSK